MKVYPSPRKAYYTAPDLSQAHVLVVYYNTAKNGHYGLGVNALHTVKVLQKNFVRANLVAVASLADIEDALIKYGDVTHCIIEAPWLSTANLSALCDRFLDTYFVVRAHSQVAFLQVEAGAVQLLREQLILQESKLNLKVAANSRRLTHYLRTAYQAFCLYLPNLYDIERPTMNPGQAHDHRLLRIGAFGAIRLLKNHISAAAAALLIAKMRSTDLEFYMNVNRQEHGVGVMQAIRNLYANVPYAKLIEVPWQDWATFRRTVANMDLTMQPSMSETFNLVTADAVTEGVPSVVSSCIEWVPLYWHCDVDDVDNIARVGSQLLSDSNAAADGLLALKQYEQQAIQTWLGWLSGQPGVSNYDSAFVGVV